MLQPTDTKIEVKDYPYGYLKTSMFFSVEFKASKGFRAVRQSINPKTGVLNKPKKGVYSDIILLDVNDEGFASFKHGQFYKQEDLNELMDYLSENFELFTPEQVEYLYMKVIGFLKMTCVSMATYCNSKTDELLPLIKDAVEKSVEGIKTGDNLFSTIKIDNEALEATEEEGYQPFRLTSYA